jgi:hypothetical protein
MPQSRLKSVLQIVPRVPGGIDGVGDYALTIAQKLKDKFGCASVFVTPDTSSPTIVRGFDVLPLERLAASAQQFDRLLLHYVNYGYQKRGLPFGLLSILRRMREQRHGKLVTIFHELYASSPPWGSAFWLQPLQIHLARSIARLSDECIVSSETLLRELRRLVPEVSVHLHPVPSGLEEPALSRDQIANRDPHRWVIVGGTVLSQRSLRSFAENRNCIPASIAPRNLFVIGGHENPITHSLLAGLRIESDYRPQISSVEASEILKTCSFTWFNYFHRPDVETSTILKSSAFAAACAHAVVPIFPHRGTTISIESDCLPGPFFISHDGREVPTDANRAALSQSIYDWYQRHASSEHLVSDIAGILGLDQRQN